MAVDVYGGLDILVNNAARNRPAAAVDERVATLDPEWCRRRWTSISPAPSSAAVLLRAMRSRGAGCIINIASTPALPATGIRAPTSPRSMGWSG
jgi:NAD(P)-dependent dehydrogenase (short-subunit alcohol dehydrogenase family)